MIESLSNLQLQYTRLVQQCYQSISSLIHGKRMVLQETCYKASLHSLFNAASSYRQQKMSFQVIFCEITILFDLLCPSCTLCTEVTFCGKLEYTICTLLLMRRFSIFTIKLPFLKPLCLFTVNSTCYFDECIVCVTMYFSPESLKSMSKYMLQSVYNILSCIHCAHVPAFSQEHFVQQDILATGW